MTLPKPVRLNQASSLYNGIIRLSLAHMENACAHRFVETWTMLRELDRMRIAVSARDHVALARIDDMLGACESAMWERSNPFRKMAFVSDDGGKFIVLPEDDPEED